MLDDDARKKELLKNFLAAWTKSGNQIDAARETFGDPKQFGKKIEAYSRQGSFRIGIIKAGQAAAEKSYTVRNVSPGEAIALRGDFFSHHNRAEQAQPVLQEALKTEPICLSCMRHSASTTTGGMKRRKPTKKCSWPSS